MFVFFVLFQDVIVYSLRAISTSNTADVTFFSVNSQTGNITLIRPLTNLPVGTELRVNYYYASMIL